MFQVLEKKNQLNEIDTNLLETSNIIALFQ